MRILLAAALCLAALAASAQIYRWTDDKGRVHVSDTPPPASAKSVQKSGGTTPGAAAASQPGKQEPYALQQARTNFPITLYTAPQCDGCGEARKLLNARGLPFREVSVTSEEQIEELKKVAGSATVPAIVIGRTVQRGFEAGQYQALLDAAGYPPPGALPPRQQSEPEAAKPALPEVKPVEPPEPAKGPYAPGAPPQRAGGS